MSINYIHIFLDNSLLRNVSKKIDEAIPTDNVGVIQPTVGKMKINTFFGKISFVNYIGDYIVIATSKCFVLLRSSFFCSKELFED